MRRCPDRGELMPREAFSGSGYCKPCHNRRTRESFARNGGARRYHLRQKYRLDLPDIMLAAQDGLCAAWREAPATDVDHDHRTGQVRALLCSACNTALGKFRDDADLIEAAIAYLEDAAPGTARERSA